MPKVPFADLAEVNPRRRMKRGERYPFIEMAAVPEGGGHPTRHGEREFNGSGSKFALGDTLFARITPCTENGKLAFVDSLPTGTVGFGSTELIVLAARPGRADPRFVYQVVASEPVRRQAVARMLGTSGRQRVPAWFFSEELAVPDFSLPEQRAIAAVLDSIDEAIERTEEVIAATERLRDALLHELLTRGLPGHHTAWRDVPGLGAIPACWDVVRLGRVVSEIRYGTSSRLSSEGRWPVLRIPNVARGFVDMTDLKYADLSPRESQTLALQPGDLLVVRTNGNPQICGASAVWRGRDGCWAFASYLLRIRTTQERLTSTYLWSYLHSVAGRRQLSGSIRTSVGNYNLSAEGLIALLLPLPPLPEQRAIADALDSVDAAIEGARGERAALQSSKASTADALLTGRVRVDPSGESTTACR